MSPDHGTAVDIIKKKVADENSLISCVNFVNKYGKWNLLKNLLDKIF